MDPVDGGKSENLNKEQYKLSNLNRNENRASKNERCLQNLWEYNKRSNDHIMGVSEGKEKECETGKYSKK